MFIFIHGISLMMRLLLALALLLICWSGVVIAQQVYVNQYGVPQVVNYLNVTNATIVVINEPLRPINGTVLIMNGTQPVPFVLLRNGSIAVFAFGSGVLNITYSANFTITSNSTLMSCYNFDEPINIKYAANVIPIEFPSPMNYSIKDDSVSMVLPPGANCIQYVTLPLTTYVSPKTLSPSTPPTSPPTTSTAAGNESPIIIAAVVAVIVAAVAVVVALRRRSR